MENTRALYLIQKSTLEQKDKDFLIKHLDIYNDILYSKELEIMRLKDIIDQGKFINNDLLSTKEQIIRAFRGDPDKKEMLDKVQMLINRLANG